MLHVFTTNESCLCKIAFTVHYDPYVYNQLAHTQALGGRYETNMASLYDYAISYVVLLDLERH